MIEAKPTIDQTDYLSCRCITRQVGSKKWHVAYCAEHVPTVSPSDIAAQRHSELMALLGEIKELLADHAAEHVRWQGDGK